MGIKLTENERQTLEQCLRNLQSLDGCRAEFAPEPTGESAGRLKLQGPWGRLDYRILTRLRLTESSAETAIHHLRGRSGDRTLLLTDYIPDRVAEKLRRSGIDYIDTAGNAHLRQPPLYIEVSGRRRPERQTRAGRAFQIAGLKLVSLLLRHPDAAAWTYRDLAREAGIALGAVGPVLKDLARRGYLAGEDEKRRVTGIDELFLRWELGYGDRLREALELQRCRWNGHSDLRRLPDMIERNAPDAGILVGGELGTRLLLGDGGAAEQLSLHCRGELLPLMLRLELVPDPEGPVHLLQRFGEGDHWSGWQPVQVPLTEPLLLHAEVATASPAREELLKELFDRHLAPRFAGSQMDR
ncbi:MAG: hypothetical protein Tsb0017_05620 [Geothermobacteraceae bacterium]